MMDEPAYDDILDPERLTDYVRRRAHSVQIFEHPEDSEIDALRTDMTTVYGLCLETKEIADASLRTAQATLEELREIHQRYLAILDSHKKYIRYLQGQQGKEKEEETVQ